MLFRVFSLHKTSPKEAERKQINTKNENWNFYRLKFGIVHCFNYVLRTLLMPLPLPLLMIMMTTTTMNMAHAMQRIYSCIHFSVWNILCFVRSVVKLVFCCSFVAQPSTLFHFYSVFMCCCITFDLACIAFFPFTHSVARFFLFLFRRVCVQHNFELDIQTEDRQNKMHTHLQKNKKSQWPNI